MNAIKETLAFTLIGFSILEVTKDLDHLRILGLLLGATSQTPIFFYHFFIYFWLFSTLGASEAVTLRSRGVAVGSPPN